MTSSGVPHSVLEGTVIADDDDDEEDDDDVPL